MQKLQQQQSKVAESSRPAFQVVIIEDNEAQRKIYQQIFDNLDLAIDIHLAENGYAGLIAIGKYNPDLVITDLMMPAMDGFQMIEEIQKQPELRELNIIIVSALNESDVRSHDNCRDYIYLPKPLDHKQLISHVTQCLTGDQQSSLVSSE